MLAWFDPSVDAGFIGDDDGKENDSGTFSGAGRSDGAGFIGDDDGKENDSGTFRRAVFFFFWCWGLAAAVFGSLLSVQRRPRPFGCIRTGGFCKEINLGKFGVDYLLEDGGMIGLIILIVGAIYLAVLVVVIRAVYRWAKNKGLSKAKCRLAVAGGFLAIYLPVFWDHIPTLITHQYYCATEAGFWVYKTTEQWKAENPGVMEELIENSKTSEGISPDWPLERQSDMSIAHINQRFGMVYKNHLSSSNEKKLFLNVWRWTYELQDKKTGAVLARQVNFSAGNGYLGGEPPLRFWLQIESCIDGREQSFEFNETVKRFKGARK